MNKTPKKDWNPELTIDSAANAGVLAAGIFIVLIAAATADINAAPKEKLLVYQVEPIVVTATRLKAGNATAGARPAEYEKPVNVAASSPAGVSHYNERDLKGDNHGQ